VLHYDGKGEAKDNSLRTEVISGAGLGKRVGHPTLLQLR
jgi:hypothetical protein